MRLEGTSLKLFSYDSMIDGTERKTDSRIFQIVLRNISLAIGKKKKKDLFFLQDVRKLHALFHLQYSHIFIFILIDSLF